MLKLLRSLVTPKQTATTEAAATLPSPPVAISAEGSVAFSVTENLLDANGLPLLDWNTVQQWVDGIAGEAAQARAWSECERAWLEHLRVALGPEYRLRENGTALLLSTLQGIAVNTERRLCPPSSAASTPQQMHARHRKFWGPAEIQQFWSGKSFLRADEGNELSYDLARIIVSQFSAAWDRFRPFVTSANVEDGGASAAAEHLGVHLGDAVSALLELEPSPEWAPNPAAWSGAPERGAFSAG